jgi:hypothetical protein
MKRLKKPVVVCEFSFWDRVKQAVLGFAGGVGASLVTAWMSEAPWLSHRLAQAVAWLASWQLLW